MEKLKKLISLIKGNIYYRFSIGLVALGVSLIRPEIWEFIIYVFAWTFNKLYGNGEEVKLPKANENYNEIPSLIIGSLLILFGIFTFYYWHKRKVQLEEINYKPHLGHLLNLWKGARDININPELANEEDVINAITLLNETTTLLNDSEKLLIDFSNERGHDFITLYKKIRDNTYLINIDQESFESKKLLTQRSLPLFIKINQYVNVNSKGDSKTNG